MTGQQGKSGGRRDGAGRPRSKITIRIGDQFYSPMRGLATVTEIGYQRIVIEIDGERIILDSQSHTEGSEMEPITADAVKMWRKVPTDKVGKMPYSYKIRSSLVEKYGREKNGHISNCVTAAATIVKRENKAKS